MRKTRYGVILVILALTLAGCMAPKEELNEPQFPLKEEAVTEVLEELSLPWVLCGDETQRTSKDGRESVLYTLRDPEKKLNEESDTTIFYAGVLSGVVENGRRLNVCFSSKSFQLSEKPFSWEDWEQQILFSTMLYGIADREEACQALFKQQIPEENGPLQWKAQLSNAYCVVKRSGVRDHDYVLWIDFYESEEQYQKEKSLK